MAAAKLRLGAMTSSLALPDGYDTIIGESGATISGGETPAAPIARAMLKDAPIIILDEATANADPENEAELQEAIEALTGGKTIIMIAHRLKTVRNADQILVLDHGEMFSTAQYMTSSLGNKESMPTSF